MLEQKRISLDLICRIFHNHSVFGEDFFPGFGFRVSKRFKVWKSFQCEGVLVIILFSQNFNINFSSKTLCLTPNSTCFHACTLAIGFISDKHMFYLQTVGSFKALRMCHLHKSSQMGSQQRQTQKR